MWSSLRKRSIRKSFRHLFDSNQFGFKVFESYAVCSLLQIGSFINSLRFFFNVICFMASFLFQCYLHSLQNTMDHLSYALTLWRNNTNTELLNTDNLLALLAVNQNEESIAIEILPDNRNQSSISVRILAFCKLNDLASVFDALEKVLMDDKFKLPIEVVSRRFFDIFFKSDQRK